jgi:hypothetical protein
LPCRIQKKKKEKKKKKKKEKKKDLACIETEIVKVHLVACF